MRLPSNGVVCGAVGAALALASLLPHLGFTVDDAGIAARYAVNLASGTGYRFNPGGPLSDGVTPLPLTPLLAALAGDRGILHTWDVARWLGGAIWVGAAARLGWWCASAGQRATRFIPLLLLALCAPLALWQLGGLETGIVTALATVASTCPPTRRGVCTACLLGGMTAAFRPEMTPFAVAFGVSRVWPLRWRGEFAVPALLALAPAGITACVRLAVFGSPVPIPYYAKPGSLALGLNYVFWGMILTGAPALAVAPLRLLQDARLARARRLLAACLVHVAAVAWAGGDWMGYWRLLVPILPLFAIAGVDIAEYSASFVTQAPRYLLALWAMATIWRSIPVGHWSVMAQRDALVTAGRAALADARVIATIEIGWIGAAAPSATIVDLAGLTDLEIAKLPGRHVEKAISAALLEERGVDALVFRKDVTAPAGSRSDAGPYSRALENRLAADPWVRRIFAPVRELRPDTHVAYVVWRRVSPLAR